MLLDHVKHWHCGLARIIEGRPEIRGYHARLARLRGGQRGKHRRCYLLLGGTTREARRSARAYRARLAHLKGTDKIKVA